MKQNMKSLKKNKTNSIETETESIKSLYQLQNRLTFPFNVVTFSKGIKNENKKSINRRNSAPIIRKIANSNSLEKVKNVNSNKKLSYFNNTLSTNFSINNTKKSQFLKKEAHKGKSKLQIRRNSSKQLSNIQQQVRLQCQTIKNLFISPIQNKEQVLLNLEKMRKCLQKSKKNIFYGRLLTQVTQKYETIIEFVMKQNLKIPIQSKKSNSYCIQKQNKQLKKQMMNQEKKQSLVLNLTEIKNRNIPDYQDQFLSKADQFSQSWTDLMQRQNRY